MLFVHQSNRLEVLADQFSQLYSSHTDSPLSAEWVVVPNYPVERWLSLKLADLLGISANLKFTFPAEFSWSMLRAVIGQLPETAPFSPGNLRWLILVVLEQQADDFPELSEYLQEADQKRIFELSCQLEIVFDRYLFYRPGWIEKWERGEESENWQARLWQKIVASAEANHWVALRKQFVQSLPSPAFSLPQRVSFFAISELSPGYLQLLGSLAEFVDIHIFAVNPCAEFWSDIVPEKTILNTTEEVSEYLEVGNPLLASMGRQGRDFFDLLLNQDNVEEDQTFILPTGDTLLSSIQQDVLELKQTTVENPELADDSISIHSCHSFMREAEVIHDQILAALDEDKTLATTDIIIMTPDINAAAPYIEAVFSTSDTKIPYSISDASLSGENEFAEVLLALLELPNSRFEVNRVLGFLELSIVRQRFGLDKSAVSHLSQWCDSTNIRWGIDAEQRMAIGLPETGEHSWRNGLDRMLLGYMMNSDGFYQGTLAYTEIEGSLASDLGRFTEFAEKLFAVAKWKNLQLSLTDWVVKLETMLDSIAVSEKDDSVERQQLRTLLLELTSQTDDADYTGTLDFDCFRYLIQQELAASQQSKRFMSDGVTVSRFTPMRNLPFSVVCLMGMNDKDFPARTPRQSFDMASQTYWRGDRSARNSDRYLFLEALLSARKKLIISYCGQDMKSNDPRPPSVLVDELLDYSLESYGITRSELVVKHPLQAFSSRYFNSDPENSGSENSGSENSGSENKIKLFTYNRFRNGDVTSQQTLPEPFLQPDHIIAREEPEIIEIKQLEQFLKNPVRFFIRDILGISLGEELADLAEREPFALESFIDAEILQMIRDETGDVVERLRALGHLPHGKWGDQLFHQQATIATEFIARLPLLKSPQSKSFEISIGKYKLRGVLNDIYQQGQIFIQMSPVWASARLPAWVRHLVYCHLESGSNVKETHIYTPNQDLILNPVANPIRHLENLIDTYIKGRMQVVKLFPKSSFEYASSQNIGKAYAKWNDSYNYSGEGSKEENQLAFSGNQAPLDEEFQLLADEIYRPFLDHVQDK